MVVIYATLALLALTIPRGLVNWSRDRTEHVAARDPHRRASDRALLERRRLNRPYERARQIFLDVTGKSED